MNRVRRSDTQEAILAGLAAGKRLVGPITLDRGPASKRRRPWGWSDGRPVDGNAVAGLIERGVLQETSAADAEREAVLRRDG